jgi:hypothetical protein
MWRDLYGTAGRASKLRVSGMYVNGVHVWRVANQECPWLCPVSVSAPKRDPWAAGAEGRPRLRLVAMQVRYLAFITIPG